MKEEKPSMAGYTHAFLSHFQTTSILSIVGFIPSSLRTMISLNPAEGFLLIHIAMQKFSPM